MSDKDSQPVQITAEERRHPAIRILARACIALAREQLERGQPADINPKPDDASDNGSEQPEVRDE